MPRGSCFVLAHRWKGKLYVCSFFFSADSTPTIGVPWRRSAMCIDEVLCALAHCFCVSILGSANDVLPLMVLVNVGEQHVSTVVQGSLGVLMC